jgi:hypothetical protein
MMFVKKKHQESEAVRVDSGPMSQPSSRVEFDEQLSRFWERANLKPPFSDIDTQISEFPTLKVDDEWKPLAPFMANAIVNLTDIKYRGNCEVYQDLGSRPQWHESFTANATISVGLLDRIAGHVISTTPLLSFFERHEFIRNNAESDALKSEPKYFVQQANYPNTTIIINHDFDMYLSQLQDSEAPDDLENWFRSRPIELYRSAEDARIYIESLWNRRNSQSGDGQPSVSAWPDIAFTTEIHHPHRSARGFGANFIRLPHEAFAGLRESLGDFKEAAVLRISADMKLLGLDPHGNNERHEAYSLWSVIDSSSELTGRLKEITVEWDNSSR